MSGNDARKTRQVATNRKARHDFFVDETIECGIVLTGTEVCSLRENGCTLRDCYALVRSGEVWLNGMHIPPYSHGTVWNVDSDRRRKLLLHKRQILQIGQKAAREGCALVPLSVYFKEGRAKVELGVCRGKKQYDKRQTLRERDAKRAIDRAIKEQRRG